MRQLSRAVVIIALGLISACAEEEASLDASASPGARDAGSDAGARDAAAAVDAGDEEDDEEQMDGSIAADASRPRDAQVPDASAASDSGQQGAMPPDLGGMDATVPMTKIDRSGLRNVGNTGLLDYSDPALWACLPGNDPNECHANLDATEILKDGTRKVIPHRRATSPEFDCFYVYPTVALNGGGNMTDFSDIGSVLDPLLAQGARFNRLCEVYAPLYRQVALSTDGGVTSASAGANPQLATGDVLAAFDQYMRTWNKGRNFVIIGHSQGTSMALEILRQRVDVNAGLRRQFISAVLLGGAPRVPEGERVGGTLKNIPLCAQPGETGCLIAYASYAAEAPPTPESGLFGRTTDAGVVACTDPAKLAGNSGNYAGSYFSKTTNNPSFASGEPPADLTTRFYVYRDFFKGECVREGEFSYLKQSINKTADDKRAVPPYRNTRLEQTGWGLHLVDFNLPLEDLITAVDKQSATKLGKK